MLKPSPSTSPRVAVAHSRLKSDEEQVEETLKPRQARRAQIRRVCLVTLSADTSQLPTFSRSQPDGQIIPYVAGLTETWLKAIIPSTRACIQKMA